MDGESAYLVLLLVSGRLSLWDLDLYLVGENRHSVLLLVSCQLSLKTNVLGDILVGIVRERAFGSPLCQLSVVANNKSCM